MKTLGVVDTIPQMLGLVKGRVFKVTIQAINLATNALQPVELLGASSEFNRALVHHGLIVTIPCSFRDREHWHGLL